MKKTKLLLWCRIILGSFLCVFFNMQQGYSQSVNIKGFVSDKTGPIPGVSVLMKGTGNGVITNNEGAYSITVPNPNTILVFSFVGYQTQEIKLGDRKTLDVLLEDHNVLDEVVVTALGLKRETRALGYAISSIKGDDMVVAGNTVNPLSSLYGKAAGVGIQSSVGGPTGGINIKIRGSASLETSSSTRPLFVVDGVPIYDVNSDMSSRGYDPLNSFDYGSGINDINPEDIESMEILKGAKASVLYGSEGANGVVLITTKSGQSTRGLGVQLSFQHTFEVPHSYIEWQNEYGTGSDIYAWAKTDKGDRKIVSDRFSFGPKFDGSDITFFDGSVQKYEAYPNNFDDLFKSGYSNNVSVAISGGSEKGSMRAAYSYYDYHGIMENFGQKKNTLSFSGKMNASKFASFELVSNLYNIQTENRLPNISDVVAWGFHRDYDFNKLKNNLRGADGYFNKEFYDDGGLPNSSKTLMNIWWHQNENKNKDTKIHNITSVRANLKFWEWLYLIVQGGVDYTNIDYNTEEPIKTMIPDKTGGKYAFKRENFLIQNYEGFLNFEKDIVKDFHLHTFVGGAYRSRAFNSVGVSTYGGLDYPNWYSLENSVNWPGKSNAGNVRSHSRTSEFSYSVFGTATFSWKNTYYLELQARNDWNSTLPPSNNSYFYPGVSFTWNFTDEIKIPGVNYGKFRASWADVGRGAPLYFALKSYSIEYLPLSPGVANVGGPSDLFAGDLKPERKREYEVGLNMRLMEQNRMEVDFSYYTNNVYNQIMGVPLSRPTGAENIRINAGNVRNWGWEALIKFAPLIHHNCRWDLTFTAANQYSKVIKLYDGITSKPLGGDGYSVVAEEGKRFGEVMMYDYERDPNGNRIVGKNGLYSLDKTKMVPINKNINPDFFGGVSSNFSWKSINFHVGIDYKFGGSIFSYSNYYLRGLGLSKNTLQYRDESHGGLAYYIDKESKIVPWQHNQPAPSDSKNGLVYHNGMILDGVKLAENGNYVKNDQIANSNSYYQSFISDMGDAFQPDALYKNDYIKLRELALGYTLPKKWSEKVKMQKVSFQLIARNLFYLYKTLPNVDAESTLGTSGENSYREQSFYPTIRTFGFNINLSF